MIDSKQKVPSVSTGSTKLTFSNKAEVDNFVLLLKDLTKNPKKSKLAQQYEADMLKALDNQGKVAFQKI